MPTTRSKNMPNVVADQEGLQWFNTILAPTVDERVYV